MIISGALLAFFISIFGQAFPCQDMFFSPRETKGMQEIHSDKGDMIVRPLELIDGAYATKK